MKYLIKSGLFSAVAHPDSIKCFDYYPSFDLTEIYSEIADMLNEYDMIGTLNKMQDYVGIMAIMNLEGIEKCIISLDRKMYTASDAHRPEDTQGLT